MTLPAPAPVYYSRRVRLYLADLWSRRDFAWFLAMGNVKARNASTALGLLWWVINPLLLGLVYYFVFGILFESARDISYLLTGMFVFHFTSQAMSGGANSILQNSKLLANLKFPRLILPISNLIEATVGFLASLVILYAIAIPFSGIFPGPSIVLLLIALPLQLMFNLGLAAITARMAVPFRDINNLLPYVNRVWLYLSPIIWPLEFLSRMSPTVQTIAEINPMFPMIEVYRAALLGYPLDLTHLAWFAFWAVAVLIVGIALFVKYEGQIVRYL
ncbi:MAG TPA: ABC transporter permease [Acidimicrobiia bacterium]|nr:ABC transporter permease [Acidimicrobiia bacterium]